MANYTEFNAQDAFLYVDTFRTAIKSNAAAVATQKERLKERQRQGGTGGSRYFAELRALEHAMNFLVNREEPKQVVLADAEALEQVDMEGQLKAELGACREALQGETMNLRKVQKEMLKAREMITAQQTEVVTQRQEVNRLRRKLTQTSSTFAVVVIAMFTVIAILLVILSY